MKQLTTRAMKLMN